MRKRAPALINLAVNVFSLTAGVVPGQMTVNQNAEMRATPRGRKEDDLPDPEPVDFTLFADPGIVVSTSSSARPERFIRTL